ncbi:MAG TPA: hypothetical protein VKR52_20105 [Terracidiphilus sp.]|nr:hypothetical protein [Terracidiphilus sp.]
MHEKDELDRLIDSALASYAGAEDGLEERVLAHVAEVAPQRAARRLMWAVAFTLPLAACMLLLILMPRWRGESAPNKGGGSGSTIARNVQRVSPPPSEKRFPALRQHVRSGSMNRIASAPWSSDRRSATHPSLPKLDVFPTPQPLSAEEQALLSFATQAPEPDRKAALDAQQNRDAPLVIASIKIPPLATPDEGKN